jgi:hypothetical protein
MPKSGRRRSGCGRKSGCSSNWPRRRLRRHGPQGEQHADRAGGDSGGRRAQRDREAQQHDSDRGRHAEDGVGVRDRPGATEQQDQSWTDGLTERGDECAIAERGVVAVRSRSRRTLVVRPPSTGVRRPAARCRQQAHHPVAEEHKHFRGGAHQHRTQEQHPAFAEPIDCLSGRMASTSGATANAVESTPAMLTARSVPAPGRWRWDAARTSRAERARCVRAGGSAVRVPAFARRRSGQRARCRGRAHAQA